MADATDWASATEQQVLDEALRLIPTEGWTWKAVLAAGGAAGLSAAETELLLPNGPADLAALLSRRHDAAARAALAEVDPASLKIRERIARAVNARIDAACADEAAVRRLFGFLTLPPNLALGTRLAWEAADGLWRWAGDTSTDQNHYSKRAILSGILAGAMSFRLHAGAEAAQAFVTARIDNVMAYETWKAGRRPVDLLRDVAAGLGRMRYGRPG
jgi:ubiquinone biosynthesis protein COQ9